MQPVADKQLEAAQAPAKRHRLLLVDDHSILRMGMRAVLELEPDLEVIGEAGDGAEALNFIRDNVPDIVLTDLAMPGHGGLKLVGELRAGFPQVRVLVVSAHAGEEYIRAALTCGAHGYVLKDSNRADLLDGIRTVMRGEQYVCQEVSRQLLSTYLGGQQQPSKPEPVTRRERDVLTRVASGYSNKKIANELGLSVKTVQKHRQNLMQKLSLHNAAAVTAYAIQHGMVAKEPLI